MNSRWKRLLRQEIRLPWWVLVALFVGSLTMIVASHWREANRRRAAWQAADRPRPVRLETYQRFDSRTLDVLRSSGELLVDHLPADNPRGAVTRNELACIYTLQGEHETAERLFRESLEAHQTFLGSEHEDVRIIRQNLAAIKQFANAARGEHAP